MHNLNLGDIKLRHALRVTNGGFPIRIPIEKHPHLGHGVGQRLFSHGGEQIHGDQVIRPKPHHRKRRTKQRTYRHQHLRQQHRQPWSVPSRRVVGSIGDGQMRDIINCHYHMHCVLMIEWLSRGPQR